MKIRILHHDDFDGAASAWVLHRKYAELGNVECTPVQYGYPPPDLAGYDLVAIVDFSFQREDMEEIATANGELLVIDHHRTAVDRLSDWRPAGNVTCILESERDGVPVSGCELTWDHVHGPDVEVPWFIRYVGDRDVWRFALPDSRAISMEIQSRPPTVETCYHFGAVMETPDCRDMLARGGESILRYQARLIERAVARAEPMKLPVPPEMGIGSECSGFGVNSSDAISEVAGKLAERPGAQFGCCWFHGGGPSWICSLRSRGDFDVGKVAEHMGGGGHAKAAGFSCTNPPLFIEKTQIVLTGGE